MFKFSKSKHLNFAAIYDSAENLFNEIPAIKKRRKIRRYFLIIKYFSIAVITSVVLILILLSPYFLNIKDTFVSAVEGKSNLEIAIYQARIENFKESSDNARLAADNFRSAESSIEKIKNSFLAENFAFIDSQIEDIGYLLNTASVLSSAVEQGSGFGKEIDGLVTGEKKLSYSKFSLEEKKRILDYFYNSAPKLAELKARLDAASINLNKVRGNGVLFPFRYKIADLKDKVEFGKGILEKSIPMSKILPSIAGYPEKASYLVIFENNDELRPTGGFIGTYGILQIEYGDITRFDTHDIYHMDMPVKDRINVEPPAPIKQYLVPKWYMRDANWSPDWPTSAEQILWFYDKENKLLPQKDQINNFNGPFDGVIAITPEFVTDLLALSGPIIINGQEYNKDNFMDTLQYRVERGFVQLGVPSWQKKEVIGDIMKELKIRLLDFPASRWNEILGVFDDNILRKNMLVYLKNPALENLIKEQGWTGEIKQGKGDYLMVVDANMGALKTDAAMKRNIEYKVIKEGRDLVAKLWVNYAHNGIVDYKTDTYKSYTRIYVPTGSELIRSTGINDKVKVGEESGKTYFGGFFTVAPGGIKNLYFEYKLPDNMIEANNYQLYMQKQPGKDIDELLVDLNLGNEVKSYSPTGFFANKLSRSEVKWETDLNMDRVFTVKIR